MSVLEFILPIQKTLWLWTLKREEREMPNKNLRPLWKGWLTYNKSAYLTLRNTLIKSSFIFCHSLHGPPHCLGPGRTSSDIYKHSFFFEKRFTSSSFGSLSSEESWDGCSLKLCLFPNVIANTGEINNNSYFVSHSMAHCCWEKCKIVLVFTRHRKKKLVRKISI